MNTRTVSFVSGSELFRDCPNTWAMFTDRADDFSWGDNVHSLVNPSSVADVLDELDDSECDPKQLATVLDRIKEMSEGALIDLES